MTDEIDDQDTTAADEAFACLTEADIRERSQELHETQELWEEYAYIANPKMPCPECGGRGAVSGGSLGDICVRCEGARVLEQPGRQTVNMPPFAALRGAITAYGNALADRALPEGHLVKRGLALPPASTVPTLEDIRKLRTEAENGCKQLSGTPGLEGIRELPAAREPVEDNDLTANEDSDIEDAELDELEDQAHE